MRTIDDTRVPWLGGARKRAILVAATLVALLATLGAATPALANLKQEYEAFADCPLNTPGVVNCVVAHTTSGEFTIGNKTVPISQPITLQGGLIESESSCCEVAAAADDNTLSKTALPVPGGLVGVELGDLTEVTATAELAGTPDIDPTNIFSQGGVGVTLPVKIKLDNPALGSTCYIGSNAQPIVFGLTTGTTNPPGPNKPISGARGTLTTRGAGEIVSFTNASLVDNSFAASGANGCGGLLFLLVDPDVDLVLGVPDASGHNTAILDGSLEQSTTRAVSAYLPLPELGRCEKTEGIKEGRVTIYHGHYQDAGCVRETENEYEYEPPNGKYEWVPGTGAGKKFTGTIGALTLETVGRSEVTCAAGHSQGEYTGTKTESLSLTLTGCETVGKGKGVPCQSKAAAAGEVDSAPLEGELEFTNETEPLKPVVGWEVKPVGSGALAAFECGGAPVTVAGSVISPITTADKMATEFKVKFKAIAGKQVPEEFEGGPKDTLTLGKSGNEEQAGLTATDVVVDEEALEIKGAVTVG